MNSTGRLSCIFGLVLIINSTYAIDPAQIKVEYTGNYTGNYTEKNGTIYLTYPDGYLILTSSVYDQFGNAIGLIQLDWSTTGS